MTDAESQLLQVGVGGLRSTPPGSCEQHSWGIVGSAWLSWSLGFAHVADAAIYGSGRSGCFHPVRSGIVGSVAVRSCHGISASRMLQTLPSTVPIVQDAFIPLGQALLAQWLCVAVVEFRLRACCRRCHVRVRSSGMLSSRWVRHCWQCVAVMEFRLRAGCRRCHARFRSSGMKASRWVRHCWLCVAVMEFRLRACCRRCHLRF